MSDFTFVVSLRGTVRIEAATEADARAQLADKLESCDANLGAWASGEPILIELNLSGSRLVEIDGE